LAGDPQIKTMPVNKNVSFKRFYTKQEIPVMMIRDTEACNTPVNSTEEDNPKILSVQKCAGYFIHFLVADKYKSVFHEYINKNLTYTGPDAGEYFLKTVIYHGKAISEIIANTNIPMKKPKRLPKKGLCHICESPLSHKEHCEKMKGEFPTCECLVRDHDHLTGEFRGWTHNDCNLNYNLAGKPIPIVFHNFKGYDCKMFIKELSKFRNIRFDPIVENSEKFKCLRMNFTDTANKASCIFIDSLAHMNSSLDKLTQILANYDSKESDSHSNKIFSEHIQQQTIAKLRRSFPAVSNSFPDDNQFKLILRKGVFPYDYFTSLDILNQTELLKKEDFYSKLKGEHISDDDYAFYLRINKEFNLATFGDYYNLYLKLDTLLLADICRSYKNMCLQTYQLDPFWYVSAPSLAWQSALKMTKVQLDLLEDVDMYNFLRAGIRGGVSYVATKYSEANNKEMKNYDESKTSKYIDYLDANNLYGWAMSQDLPYGGFAWVPVEANSEDNLFSNIAFSH